MVYIIVIIIELIACVITVNQVVILVINIELVGSTKGMQKSMGMEIYSALNINVTKTDILSDKMKISNTHFSVNNKPLKWELIGYRTTRNLAVAISTSSN